MSAASKLSSSSFNDSSSWSAVESVVLQDQDTPITATTSRKGKEIAQVANVALSSSKQAPCQSNRIRTLISNPPALLKLHRVKEAMDFFNTKYREFIDYDSIEVGQIDMGLFRILLKMKGMAFIIIGGEDKDYHQRSEQRALFIEDISAEVRLPEKITQLWFGFIASGRQVVTGADHLEACFARFKEYVDKIGTFKKLNEDRNINEMKQYLKMNRQVHLFLGSAAPDSKSEQLSIVIANLTKTVSPIHAEIRYNLGKEKFEICCLSENGTFINNVKLKTYKQNALDKKFTSLKEDSLIRLGKEELCIVDGMITSRPPPKADTSPKTEEEGSASGVACCCVIL